MSHTPANEWRPSKSGTSFIIGSTTYRPTRTPQAQCSSSMKANRERELADVKLLLAAPDLIEVCKAYEEWEGDIIINGDWGPGGMDPYPRLTEAQCDRMLELQAMRNAAIDKAMGIS